MFLLAVTSASIFPPSTSSTATTSTAATFSSFSSVTQSTEPFSSTLPQTTEQSSSFRIIQGSQASDNGSYSSKRGVVFISDNDSPDQVLRDISHLQFDAHKYIGLPLDERVKETENEITDTECEEYLRKFGYMVMDCKGLRGDSYSMCLSHSLRLLQSRMEINITGQ